MMRTEILNTQSVPPRDRERMLALMRAHYEHVSPEGFAEDLAKKDCVAVFREQGQISGFSSLVMLRETIARTPVRIFFSGDTVMDRAARNSVALPFAIARVMLGELDREPGAAVYWLLTSKGYKTFRCLPVFFKDFHPWGNRALSGFEHGVLSAVCRRLFNGRLDQRRWILRASNTDQRLRPGVAEITESLRRRADIAMFETLNPGHARGDELVCMARFSRENLHPHILRKLDAS